MRPAYSTTPKYGLDDWRIEVRFSRTELPESGKAGQLRPLGFTEWPVRKRTFTVLPRLGCHILPVRGRSNATFI